jgi:hypothetical protein
MLKEIKRPPAPQFISFELVQDTGITKRWQVHTLDLSVVLGSVHWFGRWRKYAFFPLQETVYEHHCLRDIANFAEYQSRLHMEGRKHARAKQAATTREQ